MKFGHAHFYARSAFGKKVLVHRSAPDAVTAYGTIARFNRNTGKPHEHTREIARNTMSIAERREAGYNDKSYRRA